MIDTMAGNYRLVAKLGVGGMGEVYKAVHATIGSKVAIKVLHATGDHEAEERFLREAKAVNLIEHDGVVKVIDAGRLASGQPYLVMELLEGNSLAELAKVAPLSITDACSVIADVLDALASAHAVGVVHRDLKPANIFRTRSGRTVVLDFGIAKLLKAERLTMHGFAIGTPEYMAPEQIADREVGPATDLYTAGVVLYELLTQRLPFSGATIDVLNAHLNLEPPPPRTVRPDLSPRLSDLVLQALEKDPARRFASAAAMRDALRTVVAAPARAEPPPTMPLATRDLVVGNDATVQLGGNAATRVERPRSEPAPAFPPGTPATVHVPDETPPRIEGPPPRRRSKWPLIVIPLVLAGVAALVIVKLTGSKPAPVVATADAAESLDAAVVVTADDAPSIDAAIIVDASTLTTEPADLETQRRAAQLPSLQNRIVSTCQAEQTVVDNLPIEDDPQIAAAHRARELYMNSLACMHLLAFHADAREKNIQRVDDWLAQKRPALALGTLASIERTLRSIRIDGPLVTTRVKWIQHLLPKVSDATAQRIEELLTDLDAQVEAGAFDVANLLADEAEAQANKSIELNDPQ